MGISADGLGNVSISGYTGIDLTAIPPVGDWDGFISKYDASGEFQWTQQLGTSGDEFTYGVSADGLGNAYISGSTTGTLGATNAGGQDAFLSKYDASGSLQWTQQFGTSEIDGSGGVSADGMGGVYISGWTGGDLGGPNAGGFADAFISKYDANGMLLWTQQLGTSENDTSTSVSADGLGNVYISGHTFGDLDSPNAGNTDAYISKYDATGTHQWSRQLGTSSHDGSTGVSADGLGNVYISGYTQGNLDGANAGGSDAFISKYDASGILLWTQQFGTSSSDYVEGVSTDGMGGVYISGWTGGHLGGGSAGGRDAFVVSVVPPSPDPDANGDGHIDGTDYLLWAANFGKYPADYPPGPPLNGDFNFDERVDGLDYLVWAGAFGQGPNDSVAVPEPGALGVALVGLAGTLAVARNTRRSSSILSF